MKVSVITGLFLLATIVLVSASTGDDCSGEACAGNSKVAIFIDFSISNQKKEFEILSKALISVTNCASIGPDNVAVALGHICEKVDLKVDINEGVDPDKIYAALTAIATVDACTSTQANIVKSIEAITNVNIFPVDGRTTNVGILIISAKTLEDINFLAAVQLLSTKISDLRIFVLGKAQIPAHLASLLVAVKFYAVEDIKLLLSAEIQSHLLNPFCSRSLFDCPSGYRSDRLNPVFCRDINECEESGSKPCSEVCRNAAGSYVCDCPKGKAVSPVDIRACIDVEVCPPSAAVILVLAASSDVNIKLYKAQVNLCVSLLTSALIKYDPSLISLLYLRSGLETSINVSPSSLTLIAEELQKSSLMDAKVNLDFNITVLSNLLIKNKEHGATILLFVSKTTERFLKLYAELYNKGNAKIIVIHLDRESVPIESIRYFGEENCFARRDVRTFHYIFAKVAARLCVQVKAAASVTVSK